MRVMWAVAHNGQRLPIPDDAPTPLRDLMAQCFKDAHERPTFREILRILDNIRESDLPPDIFPTSSPASSDTLVTLPDMGGRRSEAILELEDV